MPAAPISASPIKPCGRRNKKGEPIDPWSPQTYLPLIHTETEELYCWIFRSEGAKQAFRGLCRAYSPYRNIRTLPVVSLQTSGYSHPDYAWIDIPVLKIECWEKETAPLSGAEDNIIESDEPIRIDRIEDDIPQDYE